MNLLKGLPGEPALQGDLTLTDTDETTVLYKLSKADGAVTTAGIPKWSGIEAGLTAHAGGGQGSALALSTTKPVHQVSTVGTAADSVKLPAATGSGALHLVKNGAAANSLQVFGSGTDTIDGVATGTGVAIAAGKARLFCDFGAGTWFSLLGA